MIAMIEAPFGTAAVALTRRGDRPLTAGTATKRRAVGVTAIARHTDGEQAVAQPTGLLAKGGVHGVGAAGRSGWTSSPNRGTRERTASACRSARQSRGPGGSVRVLTSAFSAYAIGQHNTTDEGVDGVASGGRTERAHSRLENRTERGFPQPPTPSTLFRKDQQEDKSQNDRTTAVQIYAISGERRHR